MPVLALGALIVFVLVAVLVAWARRSPRTSTETLGAEARWLLRPLRELRQQLVTIAEKGRGTTAAAIAQEAVGEADHILESAEVLVKTREQLKQGLKGQGEAETSLGRLQRDREAAQTDAERTSLDQAIEARHSEISAYATAKGRIAEIDGRLRQAEATLSELKARLATGMVSRSDASEQEFTDMVARLKSLGQSFDEAEETLGVGQS
ncbi:MAG: hypothetical protein JSS66_00310 [Armatimonadetes bacterium]|nr:hypothetical protein [Armatimonadota bacterium]